MQRTRDLITINCSLPVQCLLQIGEYKRNLIRRLFLQMPDAAHASELSSERERESFELDKPRYGML